MPDIPASHRDLLDSDFATLATVGPDGRPQVSEVWFLTEGDQDTVRVTATDAWLRLDARYGAVVRRRHALLPLLV